MPREAYTRFRASFQFRLFLFFALLTALLTTLFFSLYIFQEIREQRGQIQERLHQQALRLAESIRLPLYAENRATLQQLAEEEIRAPHLRSITITSANGTVLAGVRPAISVTAELISETVEVRSSTLAGSVEATLSGAQDSENALIGSIIIERDISDLSSKILPSVISAIVMAVIFWLTLSVLSYLILKKVTRSFTELMTGIEQMKGGNFTSRITVTSHDEPARAALAVNELAATLKLREEENALLMEERLALERQMLHTQKLESLGVMAGGIAHDFNNLLQGVLGNMELAMATLAPGTEPQKFITHAMSAAQRAANLSGLMLTYVGKGFLDKKLLNLNELIRNNGEILNTAISASVSLEMSLSPELPAIHAGESQIQQVVMNLITNAAEAITEQPGYIRIVTGVQQCDQTCLQSSLLEEKPQPGYFVFMEITDNGCGMDGKTLARLFDPFFTTKFTGRGLGMSAVLGILRTHSGAIFVKSAPDSGTTFRVLFPVSGFQPETVPEPVVAPQEQRTAPEQSRAGMVLLVDDEKIVLKICTKMLELCGFRVITAVDGIDAVTQFREQIEEISVVLMDLTMPNMDGITAMNEIYKIRSDARVILSSGFNKEELSERITLEHPPAGFIRKPYSMTVLRDELQRVMSAGREPDGRPLHGVSD
ncbi:MAG: response regulator [Desulfuromonadaceae bacterium]|nr:response regulator [Desulfuromonadaceae bacterium]MDD5107476.1 response regulator [Desulfuromonadaceae bacterium]